MLLCCEAIDCLTRPAWRLLRHHSVVQTGRVLGFVISKMDTNDTVQSLLVEKALTSSYWVMQGATWT